MFYVTFTNTNHTSIFLEQNHLFWSVNICTPKNDDHILNKCWYDLHLQMLQKTACFMHIKSQLLRIFRDILYKNVQHMQPKWCFMYMLCTNMYKMCLFDWCLDIVLVQCNNCVFPSVFSEVKTCFYTIAAL